MTTKVLLTGATGFVGRHVLNELIERGMVAYPVVREGNEERFSARAGIGRVLSTSALFAESDSWWAEALADIDIVVHLAWYAEPGKYLTSPINLDCLAGTLAMAKGAAAAGVKRFVGIGTCFEYELTGRPLTTDTPLKPSTPYAGAKAAAFLALSQWLPQNGVEFAWCRLFYLYGEGEDERRFVPYLRNSLASGRKADLTQGLQVRDFLDIREAARMIVDVSVSTAQGAVNICSGVPITIREFAERIADEYGRRDLLNFGGRAENLVDPPHVVGVK
ncbi:NAD(P)-dependent oxidoreductase [Sinorhizobium numidicum]|uniref:NAD(P)-dependent oxidoreductase n=1 Tax=Sinorhizobium numidicum TaxID=680248 RepID=A0ABY8CXC0_9HYPH|nr:NAD(P)-dependent oxidoreductase [Sinorhizobium numidicum]WEX76633.1 NAD(P)-dependent oxidoreductase [Sinorhizobium numidicum]WEX83294.1 NAD(P)-dependent oxidoreductase [Sinorhizobium numidicum]